MEKVKKSIKNVFRFCGRFGQALKRLGDTCGKKAYVVCVGDVLLGGITPFLSMALPGVIVACLTSQRSAGSILLWIAGYTAFLQGLEVVRGWFQNESEKSIFFARGNLMPEYFGKCVRIEASLYESAEGQKKIGDALYNISDGTDVGIGCYLRSWKAFFKNLLGLSVYGFLIAQKQWIFFMVLLLQTALVAVFHVWAGKWKERFSEERDGIFNAFWYLRRESLLPANGKDIRIYRMEKWFMEAFEKWTDMAAVNRKNGEKGFLAAEMAELALSFVRDIIAYGYLILMLAEGRMTVAAFLVYIGLVAGFGSWMKNLFSEFTIILHTDHHMESYLSFLEMEEGNQPDKAMPSAPQTAHELTMEGVCFRYEGSKEDTIRNMDLTIRPGERIALVGKNGAGKTTMVKLLCGLLRPTAGRILMDGQDIGQMNPAEYFKEFAVVFQDVFTFSFSLEDNVSCQESADRGKLEESLKAAGLWEKAESFPQKTKTVLNKDLDEAGVTLSGGEVQKLMLARALYKDAPVVILDEPTAALDPIAEGEMYEKYDRMLRDKTGIFISHRLSSTRFCDRVLFLEDGRITEQGTHEQLMEANGAYAQMFMIQAGYYQEKKGEEIDA